MNTVPVEIVVKVFEQLDSISDVLAFASTSRRLSGIWKSNVSVIYRQIGPRCIPEESHARQFHFDDRDVDSSSAMMYSDVLECAHNAIVVEKAILQFEAEIVWRVKCTSPQAPNPSRELPNNPTLTSHSDRSHHGRKRILLRLQQPQAPTPPHSNRTPTFHPPVLSTLGLAEAISPGAACPLGIILSHAPLPATRNLENPVRHWREGGT